MPDLHRFLEAQANARADHAKAIAELQRGRKQSHWIWYVFPQIIGLGRSEITERFAIEDIDEGRAYLAHPLLGLRLLEIAEIVLNQLRSPQSVPLEDLMGGRTDALKLVSSLTLFRLIAQQMTSDTDPTVAERAAKLAGCCSDVLDIATIQGFPACAFTQRTVAKAQ